MTSAKTKDEPSTSSSRFIEELNRKFPPPMPSTQTSPTGRMSAAVETKVPKQTTLSRASSKASARSASARLQLGKTKEQINDLLKENSQGSTTARGALATIAQKYGIPLELRPKVWPILLDSHPMASSNWPPDPSDDSQEAEVPLKKIYAEIAHYHRREKNIPGTRIPTPPRSAASSGDSTRSTMIYPLQVEAIDDEALDEMALDDAVKDAVTSFLARHTKVQYSNSMIHICFALADWLFPPPNASCLTSEDHQRNSTELTRLFEKLMYIILRSTAQSEHEEPRTDNGSLRLCVNGFLRKFRKLLPELHRYFAEEEMDSPKEQWLQLWMQWWCVKELKKTQRARLWDFYLGCRLSTDEIDSATVQGEQQEEMVQPNTPSAWHPFVCLALLRASKDQLQELDVDEMRVLLACPPQFDMQAILKEAASLRSELAELQAQGETV